MKINHEISSDLQGLCSLVIAIQEFNQEHSSARKIKSLFSAALLSSIGELGAESENPQVSTSHSIDRATDSAEKIFNLHLAAMNQLGINIELNRFRADINSLRDDFPDQIEEFHTHSSAHRGDLLELGIVDEQKLLDFFRALKLVDVRNDKVQEVLSVVAHEIDRSIIRFYICQSLGREDEQAKKIFELAGEISSELRRLGLSKTADLLIYHLEHIWQGDLRELLIAEQGQILPGSGFKPHNWHEDASPKYYAPRWDKALSALEQVAENPKAGSIFIESYHYLRESIEVAGEHFLSVERSDDKSHNHRPHLEEFREILAKASTRLDDLSWRLE